MAFAREDEKNGEPLLLLYEDQESGDRAMNAVFKRDVSKDDKLKGQVEEGRYYDLITPYGYGGFLGKITLPELLQTTYQNYCISKGYVCEFVRFELFTDYYQHYEGEVESRTHNVVRTLYISLDDIWMDFKQKVRKNVKRANSYGLQILIENTNEHLADFLDIYYSTMSRCDAEQEYYFSKVFFETLNCMKDNIMYFYAVHEGEIVSAELVIYGAEHAYSYLGGTKSEYFDLRPNDFLKYEIIKWGHEKGLKDFVLGGGYGSDDGIFQYKTALAPNGIMDFYIGRRIFDENAYKMLVEMRAKDNPECINSPYFPRYRA